MSSILTNNSAMVALETLRGINRNLEGVQNEISTGKSVSSAKDNASIWAISTVMSTDVQSFNQISNSLNKGAASVGLARKASEDITGLLQEMKDLIVSAQEDLNADDRSRIQTDIDAKRTQISNIVNAAQTNGQNLLKGTDAINVLASLDRASDGTVSATKIQVSRNDLQTSAAVDAAAKESGDAGFAATEDSATTTDVDKDSGDPGTITATGDTDGTVDEDATITLTIKAGEINAGDTFEFTVGTQDVSVTATADDTTATIADKLRTAITDAGGTNVGAVAGANGADPSTDDSTIIITATGGDMTFDTSTISTTFEQSQIDEDDSIAITFAGGTIAEGDAFSVGGVTYTAGADETVNDVVAGLKELLDDEGIENLVVTVTDAEDPTTDAATLTLTATGGDAVVGISDLASTDAAVAAGGLGAIADLSVATEADAETALNTIEDLLDTAIGAATSFGSAQRQIEGQSEFVQSLVDSMTSGIGTMVDADIEAASAKLQALQVQQQLGVQALSIANSAPQTLLALFR